MCSHEVMDILIDAPSDSLLDLTFTDPRNVMKGPAELTVKTMVNGNIEEVKKINTLKDMNVWNVLRDNKIEIYAGKAKIGRMMIDN